MTARLAPVLAPALALLVAACAAWETTTPNYAPPPVDGPTPSHPAPDQPPAPEPPAQPVTTAQIAIASVQLLEDCPEPAPEPAPAQVPDDAGGATKMSEQQTSASQRKAPGGSYKRMCSQSTVQLSVRSDGVGQFKIVGVQVLAAASKQVAGTTKLRGPTAWTDASGSYGPWDERTVAGAEVKVSYKMSDLDLTGSEKLVGDSFNTYNGPFMLELDVTIDGERRTIRSPEFMREPLDVMVT